MSMKDEINNFRDQVHQRSLEAGWWEPSDWTNVPTKLCLIHSEISEGLEGYRKNLKDDKLPHRDMLEVELADAMIRIGDLAGHLGYDLGGAIEEKMAFNLHRRDHKIEARLRSEGKKF